MLSIDKIPIKAVQYWGYTQRIFCEVLHDVPENTEEMLQRVAAPHKYESDRTRRGLDDKANQAHLAIHSKPAVERIIMRVDELLKMDAFVPKFPFNEALHCLRRQTSELRVFLKILNVPLVSNHLTTELQPTPMGCKSGIQFWTELESEKADIIQSLVKTCTLLCADPYFCLTDVLQRIAVQPEKKIIKTDAAIVKSVFRRRPHAIRRHSGCLDGSGLNVYISTQTESSPCSPGR